MTPSRVEIHLFDSSLLRGNYLNDPTTRRTAIYLPPGYDDDTRAHYPLVLFLPGFTGRGTMMLNESAWDENIQERLDRLITTHAISPLIALLPDCFTRYGGSQYINSSGTGRYMDHIVAELVPWADATFRTMPSRDHRAVAGISSGGFGALTLAMHHPDIFGAVISHSGDMHFDFCYRPDFPPFLNAIGKYGGVAKFIQTFRDIRPRGRDVHTCLNIIGMASCYSPNPDSPLGFDLPVHPETGEWYGDVWTRWKAYDPVELVPTYTSALKTLQLLFFDAGTRDEFNLQYGARVLASHLRRAGVPFRHQEYDDGHSGISYRYDVSLAALSDVWS